MTEQDGTVLPDAWVARAAAIAFLALVLTVIGLPSAAMTELDRQLMRASWRGETVRVRELLDRGANAASEDANGVSPLMVAAARGHRTIANFLIKAGADVNKTGCKGCAAITWAARNGWSDMIRFLAGQSADIDHRDGGGLTPLMRAAWNGKRDAVVALLDLGADILARDRRGNSVLGFALSQSEDEIFELLSAAWLARTGKLPELAEQDYVQPPLTVCSEPQISQ